MKQGLIRVTWKKNASIDLPRSRSKDERSYEQIDGGVHIMANVEYARAVKRRVRLCVRVTGRRVDNLAGMEVVIDGIRESLLESVRTGWEGMREVGGGC